MRRLLLWRMDLVFGSTLHVSLHLVIALGLRLGFSRNKYASGYRGWLFYFGPVRLGFEVLP